MSKITNLNTIHDFAMQCLDDSGSELLDFLTIEDAANCLTMVYITNDLTTGFAQDYENNVSIISTPTRVAVIYQGHHSFYKQQGNICQYNAIEEDMEAIRVTIDAALARWSALQ